MDTEKSVLERDADRYQWLRANYNNMLAGLIMCGPRGTLVPISELDKIIYGVRQC